MKRIYIFIFCLLAIPELRSQNRPAYDGNGDVPRSQEEMSGQDTIQKPPLDFNYYLPNDLYQASKVVDTTIANVHLTEPYYRQSLIGGHIGSELSAGYKMLYELEYSGLNLGQNVHSILESEESDRIFVSNRPYFQVQYGLGQIIRGDDFKMEFYKSFARNISLNFSYNSHTDNGTATGQSASFKELNLKLFQKSMSGRRRSYIIYKNPKITDNYLRNDALLGAANGSVTNQRRRIEIGNSYLLADSIIQGHNYPRVDSKLSLIKYGYAVLDESVQTQEQALFPFAIDGSTLATIDFENRTSGIQLENYYVTNWKEGEVKVGLDISLLSWTGLDTMGATLLPIIARGSYKRDLNRRGNFEINARIGVAEAAGDFGIISKVQYIIQSGATVAGGLTAEQFIPTLAQRGVFLNDVNADLKTYDFRNISHVGLKGSIGFPRWKLDAGFELDRFQNLILPTLEGAFGQELRSTNVIKANLQKGLRVGPIHSRHKVTVQSIDNPLLLRPKLQYDGNLYFELKLFKKKMLTRWGVDLYFSPSFNAPVFWPVLGAFGAPLSTEKSGHILIANPYLNIQVDKFFFFVKAVNASSNLRIGDEYWTAGYRIYPQKVRFGFRWRLLD